MSAESFKERAVRTTKKILRWFITLTILAAIISFSFLYWGVYDEGVRAGTILRISKKGVIFKTFEGQLNLDTFGSLKGVSPVKESFEFSVEGSDQAVIDQLQEVALSGERVNLHYVKRYVAFPWRGDTKYFAVKVERAPGPVSH